MATQQVSPMAGHLYGMTHDATTGAAIIRKPKVLKVGIGIPKGPALNVWMQRDPDGIVRWKIQFGYKSKDGEAQFKTYSTRAEAEARFNASYANAPKCPFPRKLPYFTFTKGTIIGDREQYIPDFDAIEAHGPTPTELDVIFVENQPLQASFQAWSSSQLRCKGDGKNAMRIVDWCDTPEHKAASDLAKSAGEKYFPIVGGCWTNGCPHQFPGQQGGKEVPAACKPNGVVNFQPLVSIRVGGTASFTTTGIKSVIGMFSSLYDITEVLGFAGGQLRGVPLKMVLRPFRSNHNGQAATQYAVAFEFRAKDIAALREGLLNNVLDMGRIAGGGDAPRMLIDSGDDAIDIPTVTAADAQAVTDEFFPDGEDTDAPPEDVAAPPAAATATDVKTAALSDKVEAAKRRKDAAKTAAPVVIPAPAEGAATPATQVQEKVEETVPVVQAAAPAAPVVDRKPEDMF